MKRFFICLALTAVLACTPESKPGVPISFSANEISLDSEGTARTITLVSTGGTWYVSPSASWLSVSPESGSGEVVVTVSATANPKDEEREASLDFTMPSAFSGMISIPVTQAPGEGEESGGSGGGEGGSGEGGEGGDGDTPHPVTGLQYLGGYEIPAIDLLDKEKCNDSDKEDWGNTNWYNYKTTNPDQMIVTHTFMRSGKLYRNYTLLYDKNRKAALWDAFVMNKDAYPHVVSRSNHWGNDPGIPAEWQDASASGSYNKGHLVASNYRRACSDSQNQTFYYTNQAPQNSNFNSGTWNTMENDLVANSPTGQDTIYCVVGLLYEYGEGAEVTEDYCGDVLVPSHFYTLLMRCTWKENKMSAKGCAYIFKNRAPSSGDSYSKHITTIDKIEERSGFDFFANVPKDVQDAAEKTSSPIW